MSQVVLLSSARLDGACGLLRGSTAALRRGTQRRSVSMTRKAEGGHLGTDGTMLQGPVCALRSVSELLSVLATGFAPARLCGRANRSRGHRKRRGLKHSAEGRQASRVHPCSTERSVAVRVTGGLVREVFLHTQQARPLRAHGVVVDSNACADPQQTTQTPRTHQFEAKPPATTTATNSAAQTTRAHDRSI